MKSDNSLSFANFHFFFNLDLPIFSWLRVINLMMSIVELMRQNSSCLTLTAGLAVCIVLCVGMCEVKILLPLH